MIGTKELEEFRAKISKHTPEENKALWKTNN